MRNKIKIRHSGGFSLVEMIAVISIIGIIVIISAGPLASIYKARAKAVSTELNALITQCKLNTLSGKSSRLEVEFDEDENRYKCELIYTDKSRNNEIYKTEYIGSKQSEIKVNNSKSLKSNKMIIGFSPSTGKVNFFKCGDENLLLNDENKITVQSAQTYEIVLYMLTGKSDVYKATSE